MKQAGPTTDRPPQMTNASYLFAWSISTFLIAVVIASMAIPTGQAVSPLGSRVEQINNGNAVFNGEGCINCHSMMVRFEDRILGVSATDDLMFTRNDYPGSARLGSDLQNIAGRYPESLMNARLTDPAALHPGTIMPSYKYLSERRRVNLIAYLERSALITSSLEVVRAVNSIEAAVPDEIILSMNKYLDYETSLLVLPFTSLENLMITAGGIYNSRCAVCHGIEGRGDGPVYSSGNRPGASSPLIPPMDFTSHEFRGKTNVMLYWRISEGVPGTGMTSWGRTLSEDAVWLLVLYIQSLGLDEDTESQQTGFEEYQFQQEEREANEILFIETETDSVDSGEVIASEEDGGEISGDDSETGSPGTTDENEPDGSTESTDEIPSGEDSP